MFCLCFYLEGKERQLYHSEAAESLGTLFVLPDNIHVDGDQLQLLGTFESQEKNKRKSQTVAFYNIRSEAEMRGWQKITAPISIDLTGTFEAPLGQTNLNGFDYQKQLKEQGIYQLLTVTKLKQIRKQNPTMLQFFQGLSILRKTVIVHCNTLFFSESAQYLNVLLFGYKTNEFSKISSVLANLGILHLFSLSGMHVLFFVQLFRRSCLRLGVSLEAVFWLQLLFSFVYGGLTGYSISVVRALIQASIKTANKRFDLKLSSLDCWSVTLLMALFMNPYVLFSAGGQLSYLLSFSIIYITPISKRMKHSWSRGLFFSFLLNICTIPIVGISFFEWQFAGVFFTFILLPYFEKILLPILTASFFASLLLPFNSWLTKLEFYLILQTKLFDWFNQYFSFKIVIGKFSSGLFVISGLVIVYLIYCLSRKSKQVWLPVLCLLLTLNYKYLNFRGIVAFIDVGQGDSIFIQAPFHQENILIDTGGKMSFKKAEWAKPAREKISAEYSVIPFLKSRGVQALDKVFITHGHEDHFGDLEKINEKIPIRSLYFPAGTEHSQAFYQMICVLNEKGTKCYRILAQDAIKSVFDLKILAPKKSGIGDNDNSLVVQATIAKRRFLFTGDLEKKGEQELVHQYKNQKIDVLKVGHHGSKTSTTPFFVQNFQPKEAIISCGRNNRFKHPNEEPLQALKQNNTTIFRTDTMGMIYYEWNGKSAMQRPKVVKNQD